MNFLHNIRKLDHYEIVITQVKDINNFDWTLRRDAAVWA